MDRPDSYGAGYAAAVPARSSLQPPPTTSDAPSAHLSHVRKFNGRNASRRASPASMSTRDPVI